MPTFVFKNVYTLEKKVAAASSMNRARDMIPGAHDGALWVEWECWEGGKCLWHIDNKGDCQAGRRSSL